MFKYLSHHICDIVDSSFFYLYLFDIGSKIECNHKNDLNMHSLIQHGFSTTKNTSEYISI